MGPSVVLIANKLQNKFINYKTISILKLCYNFANFAPESCIYRVGPRAIYKFEVQTALETKTVTLKVKD